MSKRLLALGFTVVLMTACNNNSADDNRNMGTRDVGFTSDQPSGYMTRSRGLFESDNHQYAPMSRGEHYSNRSNQSDEGNNTADQSQGNRRFGAASTNQAAQAPKTNQLNGEMLKVGRGFITIDPNAYSTGTPSSKYPHSQYIRGQWRIVQGQPSGNQQATPAPRQATPQQTAQPSQPTKQQPAPAQQTTPKAAPTTQSISTVESRVIELTNAERRKAGLPALQADTKLSNVAREKSRDMQQKGYFSHTSPTYGSPFDMMRDFGITYRTAGENIAKGQRTAEEVVQAWMNSEGHRKNILSSNYTHIGVGYVQSGNHWTQMFISK